MQPYLLTGFLNIPESRQGILFDSWREAAPFILFGGFPLLVLLFGLLVRTRIKPLPKLI